MNRTATLAAASLLALAGVVVVAGLKPRNAAKEALARGAKPQAYASPTAPAGSAADENARNTAATRNGERHAAQAALVAKYGESRTKLAGRVGKDFIGLLEDTTEMVELFGGGGVGGALGGSSISVNGPGDLSAKLQLDDAQKSKLQALQKELTARQTAKLRSAIDLLQRNPDAVTELLLASDAVQRNDLPAEDYQRLQDELLKAFDGLPQLFGGEEKEDPLGDALFRHGVEAMLTAEQTALLSALDAEQPAETEGAEASHERFPAMSLEDAETQLSATRKILGGAMQLMKAMPGVGDTAAE